MLFALNELHPEWKLALAALQRGYLQWLGEMEMFCYEGGLRAYQRYRSALEKLR